jgi:hypothetical protein
LFYPISKLYQKSAAFSRSLCYIATTTATATIIVATDIVIITAKTEQAQTHSKGVFVATSTIIIVSAATTTA